MTQTQIGRVIRGLAETQDALSRAMRYSPDLQDHELVAFYKDHIIKLTQMLAHPAQDIIFVHHKNKG